MEQFVHLQIKFKDMRELCIYSLKLQGLQRTHVFTELSYIDCKGRVYL